MLPSSIQLTDEQRAAVEALEHNVLVTAGAGSGKTRTLTGRYLALLMQGKQPRELAAITFTEKAAREMRNRVRQSLLDLAAANLAPASMNGNSATGPDSAIDWAALAVQLDSARIGTIHSLCAEILRAHPAEAGVDPQFEVLDEGLAAALKAQVADDVLAWCLEQDDLRPLFARFKVETLRQLAVFSLERRLDLQPWLLGEASFPSPGELMRQTVKQWAAQPQVTGILDDFAEQQEQGTLVSDAGDKLAEQIEGLLRDWQTVQNALAAGELLPAVEALRSMRNPGMNLNKGKRNSVCKDSLRDLRDLYKVGLEDWLDADPDPDVEQYYAQLMRPLRVFFGETHRRYRAALDARYALDFDDLEDLALQLLQREEIRQQWQQQLSAVLVDEFQDTNARQRDLVEALCGTQPGRLFAVGDDRQSIYRFRGADVRVFRDLQRSFAAGNGQNGLALELAATFRTHAGLLNAAGALLELAMQAETDPPPEDWVEFSPLKSQRAQPRYGAQPPYIEFLVAQAENSDEGRPQAAALLAERLHQLRQDGQLGAWDEAALLFRASTGFPAYETALADAGIPYVTVAGRGFYERPEIRDLLNLLRALADPDDDLALAGLLRSPAFGLSDAGLYLLRHAGLSTEADYRPGQNVPYFVALHSEFPFLSEADQACARRAADFLDEFGPQADRLPVAELLKAVLDWTDYPAILAAAEGQNLNRLWRNLDKLLQDAHASRLVQVRAFLEYLQTLRDVGARVGEAPQEATGAVQLMSIHRSKGLEFPLVVLADANYGGSRHSEPAYLLPEAGLAVNPDRDESNPLHYRLLKQLNQRQEDAEERRLLYVAITRAQDKLLVAGYMRSYPTGWLRDLSKAAGINLKEITPDVWTSHLLPGEHELGIFLAAANNNTAAASTKTTADPSLPATPVAEPHLPAGCPALYRPLPVFKPDPEPEIDDEEAESGLTRADGSRRSNAAIIGQMVHRALQRWRFPGHPALERTLEASALSQGLLDPQLRATALERATRLLQRLRAHPLWATLDEAERYHEVPFTRWVNGSANGEARNADIIGDGHPDSGYIDLLYRSAGQWHLLDFKTDELRNRNELEKAIAEYTRQLRRYWFAARPTLAIQRGEICFLDDLGKVTLYEIDLTASAW